MALDGIVLANITAELSESLTNARISKIAQPEKDELLLTLKSTSGQYRLLLSANASLPLIYLTKSNKPSPKTAPNFCMLLRKYLANGKIVRIWQPGLERILHFEIEHYSELGDLCHKDLILELMGKHSNLIFCDENGTIIDSIKRVNAYTSSVREVLPGKPYFIAVTQKKYDPLATTQEEFCSSVFSRAMPLSKALYQSYTGISPVIAEELCFRAGLDSDRSAACIEAGEQIRLYHSFDRMMEEVKEQRFLPELICEDAGGKSPIEFSSLPLTMYADLTVRSFDSPSEMLEQYYAAKNTRTRMRQKSSDLRRVAATALERCRKKYDLQLRQLSDTEKRDQYRVYGELIYTYGYDVPEGAKNFQAPNYDTGEEITVPLDPSLSTAENAEKYFEKYNKMKRTFEALSRQIQETRAEIEQLESICTFLDLARSEEDLIQVREELTDGGYIRHRSGQKKSRVRAKPYHYLSSDGLDLYVGKNDYQNEELTFHFASGSDWWFHAKGVPGSHVILKANGALPPDQSFEDAARLAAYYSKNRGAQKVEVDYVEKKQVKKPNGARPGFVVYYTNYSMMIDPDISGIRLIPEG